MMDPNPFSCLTAAPLIRLGLASLGPTRSDSIDVSRRASEAAGGRHAIQRGSRSSSGPELKGAADSDPGFFERLISLAIISLVTAAPPG